MPFLPRYKLLNFLANQPKSVQSIMGATDSFRDIDLVCLSVIFLVNALSETDMGQFVLLSDRSILTSPSEKLCQGIVDDDCYFLSGLCFASQSSRTRLLTSSRLS
jgi:hypothetical protein